VSRTSSATREPEPDAIDRQSLERDLDARLSGEVRFDDGSRALYAADSSNYRQVPLGVTVPRDAEDVAMIHEVCHRHGAPIVNRGAGTSLAGQTCNRAVVIDMSKYMHAVLELDPDGRSARVQPGVVLDDLRAAAGAHGLTFGPDPSTHNRCTLGGMIGNNSCGVHSVRGRRTLDNVRSLEVLTHDGLKLDVGATDAAELNQKLAGAGREASIYRALKRIADDNAAEVRERFPDIPRRVSGYPLLQLLPEHGFHVARALVGTESTCVTVLEASVDLIDDPPHRALLVIGYGDVFEAAAHVPLVLEHEPMGLEGIDSYLIENMRQRGMLERERSMLPEGGGWLIVEFGGSSSDEARSRAQELSERLARDGEPPVCAVIDDRAGQARIWHLREGALGATAREHGENTTWAGFEDAAVAPDRLDAYLRAFRELLDEHGLKGSLYGHFGDGCVHTRINFDFRTRDGIDVYRHFIAAAADLVIEFGGSLSGEHGDGQSRAALLPKMYGTRIVQAFRDFKHAWDPDNLMNPGKVVDPFAPTENLRLGTGYAPPDVTTRFAFSDDQGSFAQATLRCVGVGACRKHDGGTMCPSYMATREERHSTRGRARLLFEMLQGDPLRAGWREKAVKEALDMCLACKACKAECPVQVDMATYKAEFLSHYYDAQRRPRQAHTIGRIDRWSRLAAHAPRLANFMLQAPGLKRIAALTAGIDASRPMPRYANTTFRRWFGARKPRTGERNDAVVLWPDTFNNHFYPQTAQAGVAVLEAAGCGVQLPPTPLCCGRPLYDYGRLDEARRRLERIIDVLREPIRQGVPIVFLEPSCLSVFRDEMPNLLPHDEDAKRLYRLCMHLSEYLDRSRGRLELLDLGGRALYQAHCHQKALIGTASSARLLTAAGLDTQTLDAGCCGMAGSFGFEHPEVSRRIADRALLPAVNAAASDTLIVCDGFSCREQITRLSGRATSHLADVLASALPDTA
jgi:FAD/FMN-containing dehydrogenase/Fe-S oxidoreductase